MDNLDRDIREAARLGYGVHYGRYKADHPRTRPSCDDWQVGTDAAADPPAEESATRICERCGREFVKKKGLLHFCSETCKKEQRRQLNRESRERHKQNLGQKLCQCCGKPFYPDSPKQLYCSRACGANGRNLYRRNL